MLGLRLHGVNDLRLDEVPRPCLPKGGMILKVHACSICGSDLRNIKVGGSSHGMILPRIIGHEFSGEIVEIDDTIKEYKLGDRVVIATVLPCGKCDYCLKGNTNLCVDKESISCEYDGAFAEYIAITSKTISIGAVIPIPNNVTFEEAAITEPLSCVLNGQEISKIGLGDSVVIVGAGPLGLAHAEVAKILGATKVIISEVSQERRRIAEKSRNIDRIIDPVNENLNEVILKETNNKGADVVIVAAPSGEAQVQALKVAAIGGRINFFGGLAKGKSMISIDSNIIHYKELSINGTSDTTALHMKKIIRLLEAKKIDTDFLITKVYPLTKYKDAFELASSGKALKVIIKP